MTDHHDVSVHPANLPLDSLIAHKHTNLANDPNGPTICFRVGRGRWIPLTSHDAAILAAMLGSISEHKAEKKS